MMSRATTTCCGGKRHEGQSPFPPGRLGRYHPGDPGHVSSVHGLSPEQSDQDGLLRGQWLYPGPLHQILLQALLLLHPGQQLQGLLLGHRHLAAGGRSHGLFLCPVQNQGKADSPHPHHYLLHVRSLRRRLRVDSAAGPQRRHHKFHQGPVRRHSPGHLWVQWHASGVHHAAVLPDLPLCGRGPEQGGQLPSGGQ